jgi:phospholipase C
MLMQENRSFDHYFGTLAGVRGFDDSDALRLPNGDPVWRQPDPSTSDGYLLPYRRRLQPRPVRGGEPAPAHRPQWRPAHAAPGEGQPAQVP